MDGTRRLRPPGDDGSFFDNPHVIMQGSMETGRGAFARGDLTEHIHLLTTSSNQSPIAHVILRQYRREVCANCFAYDRGNEWKVRLSQLGKAFCTEDCEDEWRQRHDELELKAVGIVETFTQWHSKQHGSNMSGVDHGASWSNWEEARVTGDRLIDARKRQHPSKQQKKLLRSTQEIGVDPDITQYLLSGILASRTNDVQSALMTLAANPDVYKSASLVDHVNAYLVLLSILPVQLLPHVKPELCHTLISRASHNAFSVRPGDSADYGSEFLGYGVWPEASFFNHSCQPNVTKERIARQWSFRASTDIRAGQELCITYLGGEEKELSVEVRRKRLHDEWGFHCMCKRCVTESAELSAGGEMETG